jgi:hypothetical protein
MSVNKNKFFEVVTISVVSAPNKTSAMQIATSRNRTSRSVPGAEVMGRSTSAERVYADEARSLAESLNTTTS